MLNDLHQYIVVGSGPSGVSAALAALKNGLKVTMVDVGQDLPKNTQSSIERLASVEPQDWTKSDKNFLASNRALKVNGIPQKSLFGSDFMYEDDGLFFAPSRTSDSSRFAQYPTYAYGGFSRVWGGATMRLHPSDYLSWPINNLDKYYEIIERILPITLRPEDPLNSTFPCAAKINPLSSSLQSEGVFREFQRNEGSLKEIGVSFGKSRLSVKENCKLCLNCLEGCPYGNIFSAIDLLVQLKAFPKFQYLSNVRVIKFSEDESTVSITYYDDRDQLKVMVGSRLFLGAGVLGSAKIILNSSNFSRHTLVMRDSQYFMVPFLGSKYRNERCHTLAQIFIEIFSSKLSGHIIHNQLYTYNSVYSKEILSKIGKFKYIPGVIAAANFFARRMYLVQSYLHSDESGSATICLDSSNPSEPVLSITPNFDSAVIENRIKKIWAHLGAVGWYGGIKIIPFLGRVGNVGQGYHSGATLPMSSNPQGSESDTLGRPFSLKRVHVIDSSVLPSIPSGTLTLTVMANSYRIVDAVSSMDVGVGL